MAVALQPLYRPDPGRFTMLRNLFVFGLIALGVAASVQSPFYALLFYLWNSYFRPEQWVYSSWVGSLKLSFLIGSFVLAASTFSGNRPRMSVRLGLVATFTIYALVSTLTSDHYEYAMPYWQDFARVAIILCLIVTLVTDVSRLRMAILVMSLALGFEAAKQGWVQQLLHPGGLNANTHPVLGDNNGVAQGMAMLVPLFGVLAATTTFWWERSIHLFFMAGVVARGISTYSRGGFIALAAVSFMWFGRSRRKLRSVVAIALVAALVLPVMPPRFWDRIGTITQSFDNQDSSAKGRLHFWRTAASMAAAHPLLGVGMNAFPKAYDEFDSSGGEFGVARAVHSTWFGLLAEVGYPGLCLFVMLIVSAFATCRRIRRHASHPGCAELLPYAIAIETSLIAFVVSGTFLSSHYNELFWHLIGLSIALDEMYRRAMTAEVRVPARSMQPIGTPALALQAAGPLEEFAMLPGRRFEPRPTRNVFFDDSTDSTLPAHRESIH